MTSHPTLRGVRRALLPVLALAALPATMSAQQLPPAQQLLDRYIVAIGGRDAVLEHAASHTKGQFSMPAMGLTGELEVFSADPGRSLTRVNIPGIGEIRTGFDGEVGWSINPMEGPRVMQGGELAQLRDEAAPESTLRDPKLVASMETVEQTTMNGEECYKVKVVWRSGRETFDCYSTASGLIVGMLQKSESPMGVLDVTIHLSDYKPHGDVTLPTRIAQQMMGQEQIMTITSIDFGPVDAAVFELPAEIKALIGK